MPAPAIQKLINASFSGVLELIGFYHEEPRLEIRAALHLPPALRAASTKQVERLRLSSKPNEPHAIVTGLHELHELPGKPLRLDLQTLDFSHICAMREIGMRPAILSASAVLVCQETEELIVHQRAPDVATHANCMHIFGGAFNPVTDIAAGRASLKLSLQRELHEETGLQLGLSEPALFALSKEKTSGFLQFCRLGVCVSAAEAASLSCNWEGQIHRIGFDMLARSLMHERWVASGKAHIMSWLALGAPHAAPGQTFGGDSPRQLFDKLIAPG